MKLPALKEIVDERKGQAIEALSAKFAENRLPLEEYERLVEYINKIETERELIIVEKIVADYGGEKGGQPAYDSNDEDDMSGPDHYHSHGRQSLTVLSSRTFTGPVSPGRQFVSILGSEHIKIRKEDLRHRRTTLQVVSVLGDSVIFVEPGIRVTNAVIPILGGAWTDHKVSRRAEVDAPELVISGAALLGNVTVRLLKE
jgi:hypothetical protein